MAEQPAAGSRQRLGGRVWLVLVLGGMAVTTAIVAAVAFAVTTMHGTLPAPPRCQVIDPATVEAIASGSKLPGYRFDHARAVKSNDFERIYFISAEVTGPGRPNAVGTWASNRVEPGEGLIWAVDDVARSSTTWPKPSGAQTMSMADDGAELSRECVAAAGA